MTALARRIEGRRLAATAEPAGTATHPPPTGAGAAGAGTGHGPGTIAKALAELTAVGELVNKLDRRGYRLPDWPKPPRTPSLFG